MPLIEGTPYVADFIAIPPDDDESSYAYAVFRPPFDASYDLYEAVVPFGVVVDHYATTRSATVSRFTMDQPEESPVQTHDSRIAAAQIGVANIVDRLNEIENGTFLSQHNFQG